jgi:hypothetical protein
MLSEMFAFWDALVGSYLFKFVLFLCQCANYCKCVIHPKRPCDKIPLSFRKVVNKLEKKQLHQHVVHVVLMNLLLAAVKES